MKRENMKHGLIKIHKDMVIPKLISRVIPVSKIEILWKRILFDESKLKCTKLNDLLGIMKCCEN